MPLLSISRAEYDSMPGLNWSRLKFALRSPAHYVAAANGIDDTAAMRLGRAAHLALLEPQKLASEVVVFEGRRTGKAWDEFQVYYDGREILRPDELSEAVAMANAVRSVGDIAVHLEGAEVEASIAWSVGGRPCKGRVDALTSTGLLIDVKTCQDASADTFGREAVRRDYLAQLAWYFDGLAACGRSMLGAALLAIEKSPPYACALYVLDDDQLQMGRIRYSIALSVVAECEAIGKWPSYQAVQALRIPRWASIPEEYTHE